jgi:tRNA 2-thiouridine synthesizing protein A
LAYQCVNWEAGERSCGELIAALAKRIKELPPGSLLRVIATDRGAIADIPAWCRMTGHTLLEIEKQSEPPYQFIIKVRKADIKISDRRELFHGKDRCIDN